MPKQQNDDRNQSSRSDKPGGESPTRYGHHSGSGSNEPKHGERKEERGFVSRQGGDQTRRAPKSQEEDDR